MLLEDCAKSASPVTVQEPHFSVFPEFEGASYQRRYRLLIQKLLRERLYDGACFLLSSAAEGAKGHYTEPDAELAFAPFAAGIAARVACL